MLWQFVALFAVHWFADFFLQTHWQASNKSKRLDALGQHVLVYTAVLLFATPIIFEGGFYDRVGFVALNGALHFATDFCTSRWSSRLFAGQLETIVTPHPVERRAALKKDFNPHDFFVVIGFDQLIHHVTLAATMWLMFSPK